VLTFVIAREVVLVAAVGQLKDIISQGQTVARNPGRYHRNCREKGILDSSQAGVRLVQLRFLSDRQYQLEAICEQFSLEPIVIEQGEFPLQVRKVPGSSGLVFGQARGKVAVELWGRSREVLVEANEVVEVFSRQELPGIQPLSSCGGYGYQCCQSEVSIGTGSQWTEAVDCPQTCFSTCQPRPVILTFQTDPPMDSVNRTLQITSGQVVEFSYLLDITEELGLRVKLDYGDGQSAQLGQSQDTSRHIYDCNLPECNYTANLTVSEFTGVTSASTPLSQVTIKVVR